MTSFSKTIAAQVTHSCPTCGHQERSYRMKFRTPLLPALGTLSIAHAPMKTPQLAELFPGGEGRYVARYFAELEQWGLIEWKTKPRAGWDLTATGFNFLAGNATIPLYRWQREKGELPPECVDGPEVYIHELDGYHPASNKSEHEFVAL